MRHHWALWGMCVLTFFVLSSAVTDAGELSFDETTCVILSDGAKCRISIPMPSGWKNLYDDPEEGNEAKEQDRRSDPLNDTMAHYLGEDEKVEEVTVKLNKKMRLMPIRHDMFLKIQESTIKGIEQNTIAKTMQAGKGLQNKLTEEMKERLKKATILPKTVRNDRFLLFTLTIPEQIEGVDVVVVSTGGMVWMRGRVFCLYNRTFSLDESEIDEEIEQTQAFVKKWIEATCELNQVDMEGKSSILNENTAVMLETKGTGGSTTNSGKSENTFLTKILPKSLVMMLVGGIVSAFARKKKQDKAEPPNDTGEKQ